MCADEQEEGGVVMPKKNTPDLPVYVVGKPDLRNMPEDVANDFYMFLAERVLAWKAKEEAAAKEAET